MGSIRSVFDILKVRPGLGNSDLETDEDAIRVLLAAHTRLKELGWKDAIFCPKDGSVFEALEAGSSQTGLCHYKGEWPHGSWWMHEDGALWQSYPILWRQLTSMTEFTPTFAN